MKVKAYFIKLVASGRTDIFRTTIPVEDNEGKTEAIKEAKKLATEVYGYQDWMVQQCREV